MGDPSLLQCNVVEQMFKLCTRKPSSSEKNDNNNASASANKLPEQVPHKYNEIVKQAVSDIEKNSDMFSGIFLNNCRKMYWVDKKTRNNGFKLFANDMRIPWAYEERYGTWFSVKDTKDVNVQAVEMTGVSFLEVVAKMDTTLLSPEVLYEVAFVLMMKEQVAGWENPVILGLEFSIGIKEEHKKNLMEITERERWTEIRVGEFITSIENEGNLKIYLKGSEGIYPKTGIAIKCVIIRPK